jgi:hypothetical protein
MIDELLKKVEGLAPCYKLEAKYVMETVSINVGYYASLAENKAIDEIILGLKVIAVWKDLEFEVVKKVHEATKLEVKITYSSPVLNYSINEGIF